MNSRRGIYRRGHTLLTSMIMISLMSLIAASLFGLANTSTRVTARRRQSARPPAAMPE